MLVGEKMSLVKIKKDYNKSYFNELINFIRENKKLVVILCEDKILYPLSFLI